MKPSKRVLALGAVGSIVGAGVGLIPQAAQADATTQSAGDLRNGWDQTETGLTPGDVSSSDFGQIFGTQLDGQIYAEPVVANGTLIVATENDNVYGLDPATGVIKWQRAVGTAWQSSTIGCGDLAPNVGVTGTPVYDPASNAVYFTDKQNDPDAQHPNWYMHAVDPATGQDKTGFPVKIQGSPSNDASATFNPEYAMQRPGLLLMNGVVYAAFGGHCDMSPQTGPGYRGYVVGVDTTTAAIDSMWTSEVASAGPGAGIWQSGAALMSDGAGRILLTTGNGISPAMGPGTSPPGTLAESVVRLQVNADKSLSAADFFSPANATTLDLNDTDLGSGGPVGLPDGFFGSTSTLQHLAVQQGKDGRLFLLNRDNLGGRAPNDSGAVQVLGPFARQWGHQAVYGGEGGYLYTIGFGGPLRALRPGVTASGTPELVAVGTSAETFGYYAVSPIVTSDGTTPGTAVVWTVDPTAEASVNGSTPGPAVLAAYNAVPDANGTMQRLFAAPIGHGTKFATPVSDGNRIYVGNADGMIYGFGRPTNSPVTTRAVNLGNTPVGTPEKGSITLTANQAVTINTVTSPNRLFQPDTSALPVSVAAGATVTVPVTYTPSAPGTTTAILSVSTNLGNVGAVVSGTGLKDGLGSQPSSLAFSRYQATGSTQTLGVRIVNTGSVAETITSASLPNGPFTSSGLPPANTIIPVGGGMDFSVTFAPKATGSYPGTITIVSTSGTLNIPVTAASENGAGRLVLTPGNLDFGTVPLGQTATKTFGLTNAGNLPVVISKAKAPNSEFTSPTPIQEGVSVGPGNQMTVTIAFTPTVNGPTTAQYAITGDDGQGAQYVTLTGSGGVAGPPAGGGNPAVARLAGSDRYGTGVSVSQSVWANAGGDASGRKQAQSVVLARGDAFPDALAGVPLAAKVQGPLLLTDPKALPDQTLSEIKRVLPSGGTIYVLGGTSAVSDGVVLKLGQLGYHITRFGGTDRFATALQIAQQGLGNPGNVMLATGLDYADALAAGPFAAGAAAANGNPAAILLTNGQEMDPATAAYVAAKAKNSTANAPTVWAVGGPAVQAAKSLPGFVRGFSGTDRYATDAQVVQAQSGVPFVGVAVGTNFADALTGGAATAVQKGALITVPSALPASTAQLLTLLAPALRAVDVFGGTAVIPDSALTAITRSVGGHPA